MRQSKTKKCQQFLDFNISEGDRHIFSRRVKDSPVCRIRQLAEQAGDDSFGVLKKKIMSLRDIDRCQSLQSRRISGQSPSHIYCLCDTDTVYREWQSPYVCIPKKSIMERDKVKQKSVSNSLTLTYRWRSPRLFTSCKRLAMTGLVFR